MRTKSGQVTARRVPRPQHSTDALASLAAGPTFPRTSALVRADQQQAPAARGRVIMRYAISGRTSHSSPVRQRKYEPCAQGLSRWARWVLIDGALAKQ